mgnify:CR=1 FL=1
MSLPALVPRRDIDCFPRASGDEPLAVSIEDLAVRFSPRERG